MARYLLTALFLCLLSSFSVSASEVITIDPNTPDAAVLVKPDDGDTRLAVEVTYEARAKRVSVILSDLSTLTGVDLHAGYNSSDWQVRDRKMNIFVKDVPLVHLMNSIARVMKFNWSKSKNQDNPSYRLVMDRTLLLRMNREKSEREVALDGLFSSIAADYSQADIARLRDENPHLYALVSTGTAAALNNLLTAKPALRDVISESKEVRLDSMNLSPVECGILRDLMRGVLRMQAIQSPDRAKPADKITADGSITLWVNRSAVHGSQLANLDVEYFSEDVGRVSSGVSLSDLADKSAMERWRASLDASEGKHTSGTSNSGGSASSSESDNEIEKSQATWDDPMLKQKTHVTVTKTVCDSRISLADYLSSLSQAMGINIVSDDFGMRSDRLDFGDGEVVLADFLKKYCWSFEYNWWIYDSVLELRDYDWFRKRSLQIPEERLEKLRNAVASNGKLTMDDLAGVGLLTQEQYDINMRDDIVLNNPRLEQALSRDNGWLEFYLTLSKDQRKALFADGINFADFNTKQRGLLSVYMMRCVNGSMTEDNCTLVFARNVAYGNNGVLISEKNARTEPVKKNTYTLGAYFNGLETWMPVSLVIVPEYK